MKKEKKIYICEEQREKVNPFPKSKEIKKENKIVGQMLLKNEEKM